MPEARRILIVDDDADGREMMSFLLADQNDGCEVLCAETAEEAAALIEARKFDLYILDSLLSDSSGVELCARIRRADEKTPIMFYSGYEAADYIEKAKAAGADEYFVKPNDLDELMRKVRNCVNTES